MNLPAAGDGAIGDGPASRRARRWLPWLLFGATACTTTMAWGPGFAASLLAILGAHEMGHYLMARRVGVPASPPHFVPLPPVLGLPGTLGAVIAIGADRADRRQLALVAAAGPLAGFVVAVPAMAWALSGPTEYVPIEGEQLIFGHSVVTALLETYLGPAPKPGMEPLASPMFLGAWMGLFVTALNLLPMGQLDGGHLLHALLPDRSRGIAAWVFGGCVAFGAVGVLAYLDQFVPTALIEGTVVQGWTVALRPYVSPVFLMWAALVAALGIQHPPIRDERSPLGSTATLATWTCVVVFLLTVVPSGLWLQDSGTVPVEVPAASVEGESDPWPGS